MQIEVVECMYIAIQKCESKNTVVYPVKATLQLNYTSTTYLCFLPTYNS